eukprot:829262-Rhodomonas_salina.1
MHGQEWMGWGVTWSLADKCTLTLQALPSSFTISLFINTHPHTSSAPTPRGGCAQQTECAVGTRLRKKTERPDSLGVVEHGVMRKVIASHDRQDHFQLRIHDPQSQCRRHHEIKPTETAFLVQSVRRFCRFAFDCAGV